MFLVDLELRLDEFRTPNAQYYDLMYQVAPIYAGSHTYHAD